MLNRAAETVVSPSTSLRSQPQPPEREIHIVDEQHDVFWLKAIPIEGCAHGTSTVVHECLRHEQAQSLIPKPHISHQTMQLGLLPKTEAFSER
jgi:hypothetical protein